MGRKAQVTLFVVLGLLLLVIIGFAVAKFTASPEQTTGTINSAQIQLYVQSCLEQTTKQGLLLLGSQGGYTTLKGKTTVPEYPWLGEVFSQGPQQVPYWHHVTACDTPYGCVTFSPPPLCKKDACVYDGQYTGAGVSIQEQLEFYVQENIYFCLQELATLTDRFTFSAQFDKLESQITFTPEDVVSRMVLPLSIVDEQTQEELFLERFTTTLDINFAELYFLARKIIELEYQTAFVEENFLHFLSLYQGDPPNLPPFADQEFFGNTKLWLRSDAQQKIETEILPYMNFLQIVNAQRGFAPVVETGIASTDPYNVYAQGLFSYAQIVLNDTMYPDLSVSFTYPYSPIYLNINDKEILKGEQLSSGNFFMKLAGLLITKYEHEYDVIFPLLTTIQAPDAFGGEGYTFTFGLEANIINNIPMTSTRQAILIDTNNGFSTIDLANPSHHTSTQVTITTLDKYRQTPLANTQLSYECGWSFVLGITDAQGRWSGTLPHCATGGILHAENGLSYYPDAQLFDNPGSDDGQVSFVQITLELWPYVEKQITIQTLPYEDFLSGLSCAGHICAQELRWAHESILNVLTINGTTIANASEDCELLNEETGEPFIDPATGFPFTCVTQTIQRKNSEYALVMIERQPEGLVTEPSPLIPTFTFGKDGEQATLQNQITQEQLTALLSEGSLTQEEYDALVRQANGNFGLTLDLQKTQTISLIPGTYDVRSMVFTKETIQIPAEKRKEGSWPNKKTIRLPAIELPNWMKGGSEFTGGDAITFTPQQVYGTNELVVYAMVQPLPYTWRLLEAQQTIDQLQQGREDVLKPVFK